MKRRWGSLLAAVFAVATVAGSAGAWTYPLLPHVQSLAFFPERPNDAAPTGALLSASDPNTCWQVANVELDLEIPMVTVRIRHVTACGDSGSRWSYGFGLGILPAGMHTLTVRAVVDSAGDSTAEEISVPFEVIAAGGPPPPPPPPGPPPVDSVTALMLGFDVRPAAPLIGDHVTVHFTGRYPFDCGVIASAEPEGNGFGVTLAQADTCADSARTWERSFDLGTVDTAGFYTRFLHVHVPAIDIERVYAFGYRVTDPDAPVPPPPPPIDSLLAGLSAGAPNPFHDTARFAVSIAEPMNAQVAVYDLGGRLVATIHDGLLPAGTSMLLWNGRRADGSRAPGGIYFYRLTLPKRVLTRRLVLLGTP